MQTTRILTRQLRNETPAWTICSLPEGSKSPLVKSGVLVYGELLTYVECKCDGCQSLPTPFVRNEGEPNPRWAYTCEMSGETIDIDEDWVHDWRYNPDKFAEIVCDRLECEVVQKVNDNLWRLGHSRIPETEEREIVIATRFRESDAESISDSVDGQGFILLVGSKEYDVQDDQFKRRIYTFDQVVRFREDGTMDFVLNEFVNRLKDRVIQNKRGERGDVSKRKEKIARLLMSRFVQILHLKVWDSKNEVIKGTTVASIARELDIPKNSMGRYISPKWKIGDEESLCQFWFNVITNDVCFNVFSQIVKERNYSIESSDPFKVHSSLYNLFLAKMKDKQVQ